MNSAHKNALYVKMFTFTFHADIQKQTLFNHIRTYMQLQPIFSRMSFKTMKLESKHLTVVPLSDIVYFFCAAFIYLKGFDIGCIVFRLHQRLIIWLLGFKFWVLVYIRI